MLKEYEFDERFRIRSVATLVFLLVAIPVFAQLPTGQFWALLKIPAAP
jgi:hypothetical protein